jgi:hypothetical protein
VTQTTTGRDARGAAALAALVGAFLGSGPAFADDGQPPADEDALVEAGTQRPAAKDTREGHWLFAARSDLAMPAGSLVYGVGTGAILGMGPSFGGTLGLGISRYAVLEASGSYAIFSDAGGCPGCGGRSFDAGLGFSYHLVQGIAVDPWASFGMGYRYTSLSLTPNALEIGRPAASGKPYHGFDVARIAFGADFYPVPAFGLGPYVGADFGTFLGRPAPDAAPGVTPPFDPGGSVYAFFHIGLRVILDPMRGPLARPISGTKAARLER